MPYPEFIIYPTMNSQSITQYEGGFNSGDMEMEMDLCTYLESMSLGRQWGKEKENAIHDQHIMHLTDDAHDLIMSDSEDSTCHTDASDSSSNNGDEPTGCALLQQIQSSLDHYQTTDGGYLDIIFMHRSLFAACPQAHHSCARCFSDIAYAIEKRAWRADREADTEAVSAFRYEAWMIAASYTGQQTYLPMSYGGKKFDTAQVARRAFT